MCYYTLRNESHLLPFNNCHRIFTLVKHTYKCSPKQEIMKGKSSRGNVIRLTDKIPIKEVECIILYMRVIISVNVLASCILHVHQLACSPSLCSCSVFRLYSWQNRVICSESCSSRAQSLHVDKVHSIVEPI